MSDGTRQECTRTEQEFRAILADREQWKASSDRWRFEAERRLTKVCKLEEEDRFLRAELAAVKAERDALAAAIQRQDHKLAMWRDTFEAIDEDDMEASAHNALSAVYDITDDAEAQDTADSILAARDKAKDEQIAALAALIIQAQDETLRVKSAIEEGRSPYDALGLLAVTLRTDCHAILAALKQRMKDEGAAEELAMWATMLRRGWNPERSISDAMDERAAANRKEAEDGK